MNFVLTIPPVRNQNEVNEQHNGGFNCFSSALTPIVIVGGQGQVNRVVDGPQSKCYPSQQAVLTKEAGSLAKLKHTLPLIP